MEEWARVAARRNRNHGKYGSKGDEVYTTNNNYNKPWDQQLILIVETSVAATPLLVFGRVKYP